MLSEFSPEPCNVLLLTLFLSCTFFFLIISLSFNLVFCYIISCSRCLKNLYLFSIYSDTKIFCFTFFQYDLFLSGLGALWTYVNHHLEISIHCHPVASLSPLFCTISNTCGLHAFLFLGLLFCFMEHMFQ